MEEKTLTEYLTEYYNKFNEDKRFDSRHGKIEYINTMRFIHKYIEKLKNRNDSLSDNPSISILDIGAGTGAYAGPLSEEGYNVSAVELVKHNVSRLKVKFPKVQAYQGNAVKLKKFADSQFDITLLFGPMYHLFEADERMAALNEAKRVTKNNGYILIAYVMNEYSIITYAFKEHHFQECMESGKIDSSYHTSNRISDLYNYVRLEDINALNEKCGLIRETVFSPDGAANYLREELKKMTEAEFAGFVDYQYAVSERADLLGAGAHLVDIIKVNK